MTHHKLEDWERFTMFYHHQSGVFANFKTRKNVWFQPVSSRVFSMFNVTNFGVPQL